MIVGGWAWAWWMVTDVQRLKLEVMTLQPRCESVETSQGVPLTVTGVAQCKIMTERDFLTIAAEQFLGKEMSHIKAVILQTLEGHLRAILGTLTVEEVYRDRDQFASLVREVATPDVGRMGIEVLSFTIKDVYDQVDYLSSLGKARTAAVKRDANIGVAQAERDAGIREAECEKSAMDIKYGADTKIEDSRRLLNIQKAQFDTEVNARKEEAKLAYELQSAKMQQLIRSEELEITVVERRKQIAIEEKEITRKEKELEATVRLPAEAEAYKVERIAEGRKIQTLLTAQAEAERTRKLGAAEAIAIQEIGYAEAERMRSKASVYKLHGDAAILSSTLEALPKVSSWTLLIQSLDLTLLIHRRQVAAEISAPLAKTDEIIILGANSSSTSAAFSSLFGATTPAIAALTGIDLTKVIFDP